jgi:hypothetical protein
VDGTLQTDPLSFLLRDAITATDRGAAERIQLARKAVVEALLSDARVQDRFKKMRRDPICRRAIARFRSGVRAKVHPNKAVTRSGFLKPNPALGRATSLLVRDLVKRDVPWLSMYLLVYGFLSKEITEVSGLRAQLNLHIDSMNAPPLTITVLPTSTRAEDRQLIRNARRTTFTHIRGRVPRAKQASVVRNAQWYVRHVLQGVSIRQLARDYHLVEHPRQNREEFDHDCVLVSIGIAETARLLNIPRHSTK